MVELIFNSKRLHPVSRTLEDKIPISKTEYASTVYTRGG